MRHQTTKCGILVKPCGEKTRMRRQPTGTSTLPELHHGLLLWTGKYISKKVFLALHLASSFGFKVWVLIDIKTKYILNILPYIGAQKRGAL